MDLKDIRCKISSLYLYKNLCKNEVISSLIDLLICDHVDSELKLSLYSKFYYEVSLSDCCNSFSQYITSLIMEDDNPFTRSLSSGITPCDSMLTAAKCDLETLIWLAKINTDILADLCGFSNDNLPLVNSVNHPHILSLPMQSLLSELSLYHQHNGCGIYSKFVAFTWNNGVVPIENIDPLHLNELEGYENERNRVIDNTEAFIEGLPCSNMLLYGDRGTGKSATIHAILNEYSPDGLRMLEIPRESIEKITVITDALRSQPLKFILFIDDLSFDEWDEGFSAIKAMLEGTLSAKPKNVVIYATSNRRHLVREYHSDRTGDDVHLADTMQEMLSLSDRFGITVTFTNPNKSQYLSIVDGIAKQKGVTLDKEKLFLAAERWAISRSGRSPRVAKQFIDYVISRIERGKDI